MPVRLSEAGQLEGDSGDEGEAEGEGEDDGSVQDYEPSKGGKGGKGGRVGRPPKTSHEEEDEEEEVGERKPKRGRPRKAPKPAASGGSGRDALLGRLSMPFEEEEGEDVDATFGERMDLVAEASKAIKKRRNKRMAGRKTKRAHGGQLPYTLSLIMGDANTAWATGNMEEAIARAQEVITEAPSFAPPYGLLGLAYEGLGNKSKALDAYRLCAHAAPEDASAWKRLGILARELGDDDLARESFSRVARLTPSDLPATLEAAELFEKKGDVRRAVRMWRAAVEHPKLQKPADILLRMAELSFSVGDSVGVREALTDCVNFCMGTAAAAGAGAGAEAEGAGAGAGAGAEPVKGSPPKPALKVSRFRDAAAPFKPRYDDRTVALNACNMLAEHHGRAGEYATVLRLINRAAEYSLAAVKSAALPLDLEVKRAIAQLWLRDGGGAAGDAAGGPPVPAPTATFNTLWAHDVTEYSDLYLEAGLALARTGKPQAGLQALGRLRTGQPAGVPYTLPMLAALAPAGPLVEVDREALLAAVKSVAAAKTREELPPLGLVPALEGAEQCASLFTAEAECHTTLERPTRAALARLIAASLTPASIPRVLSAAAALVGVGLPIAAATLHARPATVAACTSEGDTARLYMRGYRIAKAAGEGATAADLLQSACGAGAHLQTAIIRIKRVAAVTVALKGSGPFLSAVEDACQAKGAVGQHVQAVRLLDVVVRASEALRADPTAGRERSRKGGIQVRMEGEGEGDGAGEGEVAAAPEAEEEEDGEEEVEEEEEEDEEDEDEALRLARMTETARAAAVRAGYSGLKNRGGRPRKSLPAAPDLEEEEEKEDENFEVEEEGEGEEEEEEEEEEAESGSDRDFSRSKRGRKGSKKAPKPAAPRKPAVGVSHAGGRHQADFLDQLRRLADKLGGEGKLSVEEEEVAERRAGTDPFVTRVKVGGKANAGSPMPESILAGVRRVASKYPYHVGAWTLCRLLDTRSTGKGERGGMGDSGAFSTGFRKAMVRYQSVNLDSLPLLMLVGSECLLTRQFRYAVGVYCEAYRLAPQEPLISLCIAVCFLSQVLSRVTAHRHGELLRGLSFLSNYRRLRAAQAAAGAAAGAGAPPSSPAMPPSLPLYVVSCEGLYNIGRACHALGLLHLAISAYEEALAAWDGVEAEGGPAMDVRREAAYNLCLLLKAGGAAERAQAITLRYLSYE